MRTVVDSGDPALRMARLPADKQLDFYCESMLGTNWRAQFEQDLVDAVAEVDAGLVTDDVVAEKRRLSAVMLRRLEVEEWDKERMRHFYYGSYGLGPWYFDMEERLHNPYFIGARAWNGPIEGWVGKNKKFADDIPESHVSWSSAALDAIGASPGGGSPARFDALIRDEVVKWAEVIKRADLKAE